MKWIKFAVLSALVAGGIGAGATMRSARTLTWASRRRMRSGSRLFQPPNRRPFSKNKWSKGTRPVTEGALPAYVAEELTTRLARDPQVHLVERAMLQQAVTELRLNLSDLFDPARSSQAGRLSGADAVLTGTVADLGDRYRASGRVVGVEDGAVWAAATADLWPEERLAPMVRKEP